LEWESKETVLSKSTVMMMHGVQLACENLGSCEGDWLQRGCWNNSGTRFQRQGDIDKL